MVRMIAAERMENKDGLRVLPSSWDELEKGLSGRVETRLETRRQKVNLLQGNLSLRREAIGQKKLELAHLVNPEKYDPVSSRITDSWIVSLIKARNRAERKGQQWQAADEVKLVLDGFLETRERLRRSQKSLSVNSKTVDNLFRWRSVLRERSWTDPKVEALIDQGAGRRRPDALTRDLVGLSLHRRMEQQEAAKQPVAEGKFDLPEAPEGKTRGFLARLKKPVEEVVAKIKQVPQSIGNNLQKAGETVRTAAAKFDLAAANRQWSKATGRWLAVGALAIALAVTPSVPSAVSPGTAVYQETHACPYYEIIESYGNWDPKIICEVVRMSAAQKRAGVHIRPDGSKDYGYLPVNSEALKGLGIDPLHVEKYIRGNAALSIGFSNWIYQLEGYSAFEDCQNGNVICK